MGFEPPKQERKHSRHFSSKRQADELMENTDGFGCSQCCCDSGTDRGRKWRG